MSLSTERMATMETRTLRHTAVMVLAMLLAATAAQASVWSGGSANWSSNGDPGWNGTGVPNAAGAVASFTSGGTTTQDVSGGVTVGTLSLSGSPTSDRSIAPTQGLTFNQDGAGAGYAILSNSSSKRLSLSTAGPVTLADDLLITNTVTGTGSYSISITSTIGGTGNLTFSNVSNDTAARPISLGANNNFTGSVLIQKGAVTLANPGFGGVGNAVTLGSSGNGSATLVTTGSVTSLPNNITVASGTGGTLLLGSTHTGTTTSTYSGTITLNDNLSITSVKDVGGTVAFTNVISGAGAVTKVGSGSVTFSAANTYTGNTTVSEGTLNLAATGELRFKIQNANASSQLLGSGTANLDGLFRLDVSALTDAAGTWNLVNVGTLTETFGGTFNLAFVGGATFTNQGGGTYTSGNWTFTTSDGNLTLIPEPATMALLALGGCTILVRRRQ